MTCEFCGHESHLTLTGHQLPMGAPVHCPLCGKFYGTIGELTVTVAEAEKRILESTIPRDPASH